MDANNHYLGEAGYDRIKCVFQHILDQQRQAAESAIDEASLSPDERNRMRAVTDITDGFVTQINQNPTAYRAYEDIRERTIGAIVRMAGMNGQEPQNAEDLQRLIEAGVDFFVLQFNNLWIRMNITKESLYNLLLTIRIIYEKLISWNKKAEKLTDLQLVNILLKTLFNKVLSFMSNTRFVLWVREQIDRHNLLNLVFKSVYYAGLFAVAAYCVRKLYDQK